MNLTIVKDDGIVIVDGVVATVSFDDLTGLPGDLHAVQWDGSTGHIELVSKNVKLADLSAPWIKELIARHADEVAKSETPPVTTAQVRREAYRALIQRQKTLKLDGGFEVEGIPFDSDEKARIAYLELAQRLTMDPSYTCTTWKASDGYWITMDAQMFAKVYQAGTALMESCFAWQKAQEERLAQTADEDLATFELT